MIYRNVQTLCKSIEVHSTCKMIIVLGPLVSSRFLDWSRLPIRVLFLPSASHQTKRVGTQFM